MPTRRHRSTRRTPCSTTSSWSRRSRSTGCAASTDVLAQHPIDSGLLDRQLTLHPQVALRPELFGALAYHYGNRKLVFLKHPDVVRVVRSLDDHPTLAATLTACDVAEGRWPSFATAFESLIESHVVRE